jgi:hypothetical protein
MHGYPKQPCTWRKYVKKPDIGRPTFCGENTGMIIVEWIVETNGTARASVRDARRSVETFGSNDRIVETGAIQRCFINDGRNVR